MAGHFKDEILDKLARRVNVAQFASFGPDLTLRFAWIRGVPQGQRFATAEEAVAALLAAAPEGSVNIRSYEPDNPKSRTFLYGLSGMETVLDALRKLAGEGLSTIVNETIDVHDGGVSGVAFGSALEFAPGDTPRCVEKPGTASFPRAIGRKVLETVYGFSFTLPEGPAQRVEWSLHPLRRGYRNEHVTVWEIEEPGAPPAAPQISWPNLWSRHVGDKTFGLLVAEALGLPVPRTMAIPRKLAPFTFGTPTPTGETWIRTCPREQVPGRYVTRRGWTDPYRLLQEEDPRGDALAAILAQDGVDARHSGALLAGPDGEPVVEGVSGRGDEFMVGRRPPEPLPSEVESSVRSLFRRAADTLGPVRFEWVHDGARPWIVQLHRGATATLGRTIFPGHAPRFHPFDVAAGIEPLRTLIARIEGTGDGVVLAGRVGVTSHFGDLLRRARIPSRIEEPGSP